MSGDRIVNMQGQVIWDEDEFTAVAMCPRCDAVGVHWLRQPNVKTPLPPDATPAERGMRMANLAIDGLSVASGGQGMFDPPNFSVMRVCRSCDYRWGQR